MRVLTSDGLSRWTLRTRLVALVALAWAVFVPADVVWTAALGAVLIGSAVAAAVLVPRPALLSLAQATTTAGMPSGPMSSARPRSHGRGEPRVEGLPPATVCHPGNS